MPSLPFRISTLILLRDEADRFLLLERTRSPNRGKWSPIGGKLDMERGESPVECARRETEEEVGLRVTDEDLHLFGYLSEKNYEGEKHWLMFLFLCHRRLRELPPPIEEGRFGFFAREEIDALDIPPTDAVLLWQFYDAHADGFAGMRADCAGPGPVVPVREA
jgi:8-oxo-dGTP diphosphatase